MVITLLALTALITVFATEALAAESSFEPRLTSPDRSNPYYNSTLNVFSQTGYGMPNCTAYAYGRIYEITGEAPLIKRGDAGSWWFINKNNDYYEYGQEPKLGAIACWSDHVAVVEEIGEDTITISQSHWRRIYFDTDTVTIGANRYGQTFYGFIYASDSVLEVEEPTYSYKLEVPVLQTLEPINDNPFPNMDPIFGNAPHEKMLGSRMLSNAVAVVVD